MTQFGFVLLFALLKSLQKLERFESLQTRCLVNTCT